jgi:hypothetical protein
MMTSGQCACIAPPSDSGGGIIADSTASCVVRLLRKARDLRKAAQGNGLSRRSW